VVLINLVNPVRAEDLGKTRTPTHALFLDSVTWLLLRSEIVFTAPF
jgi:hypothetical protein